MPKGVVVIAAIMIIDAGLLLWIAFEIATTGNLPGAPTGRNAPTFPLRGVLPSAFGLVYLAASLGLLALARWARAVTMGLAALGLLLDLLLISFLGAFVFPAMLFDAFVLVYLHRLRVSFGRADGAPSRGDAG